MIGRKKQKLFSIITAFCMMLTMILGGMTGTVKATGTIIAPT